MSKSWEPRNQSERHEGYKFIGPDGQEVEVPPAEIAPLNYVNQPMERERAYDVAIAIGLEFKVPCDPTPSKDGRGFNATIPMEFLEAIATKGPYRGMLK